MQVGDHQTQPVIARRRQDHLVEQVVGPLPVVVLAAGARCPGRGEARGRALEQPLRLAQPVDVGGGGSARRQARRQPLQLGADHVGLADLLKRRPAHQGAAVAEQRHDATGLQLAQGLPDRRAADGELRGDRLLPQPRADRQRPGEDPVAKLPDDVVDELRVLAVAAIAAAHLMHPRGALHHAPSPPHLPYRRGAQYSSVVSTFSRLDAVWDRLQQRRMPCPPARGGTGLVGLRGCREPQAPGDSAPRPLRGLTAGAT